MQVKIHPSWQTALQSEFEQPYFTDLVNRVKEEYTKAKVFPEPQNIFRAFDLVPFEDVKVVILGQDPYHTPGVADGLSFSSKPGNRVPPSLQNIYKEIITEFDLPKYELINSPDLTRWAEQGVLLLNNTLTVQSGLPNSHSKYGWDKFTDQVIRTLAKDRTNLVFILWGKFAILKKPLITMESDSHLILESAHPSPFSADRGFFGNGHFKKCNDWLKDHNMQEVKW
jgi:uracil-DNA glycosylase